VSAPKVAVVTQARTTSTRLPGKVLERVGDRTLLEHHLTRLGAAGLPVVVATTTNATDDGVADLAEQAGAAVFRGSEHDVLSRFRGAAEQEGLDAVVRVTSDCPLIDGAVVARGVEEFLRLGDPDGYVTNTQPRTFPRGFDFEVFSAAALEEADRSADLPGHREHVTPYLAQNVSGRVRVRNLTFEPDRSGYRVTVDTAEDLELVRRLVEEHGAAELDCAGIVRVLDAHPELVALNAHVEQKRVGG
jgi:spore coat polysaccharide biosynthesis protein SpsF